MPSTDPQRRNEMPARQTAAVCADAFTVAVGNRPHAHAYRRIKRLKGERFARTLRDYHSGLLEITNLETIIRHAGDDAAPLLPYLMTLLEVNDNDAQPPAPQDPFELLKQAGYNAFYADTLEAQNSIKTYFADGELLCTFNDASRYEEFHIIHAVKENADQIKREDFAGKEDRQDAYGTSVISIQIRKDGGFIKITNRYNHGVEHADNTFNSNPDTIIKGLSAALKNHFQVDFTALESPLPEGYILAGNQIVQYHTERNNVYLGDQVFVSNGTVHAIDKGAGDALFDEFVFNNKLKMLQGTSFGMDNSFADDFNQLYGKNPLLHVDKHGNLCLGETILIGAEKSRIKTLYLPGLDHMRANALYFAKALIQFDAPDLIEMGTDCLNQAISLTTIHIPALTQMGDNCLFHTPSLTRFKASTLVEMGSSCLKYASSLVSFSARALLTIGNDCLRHAQGLKAFEASALKRMGSGCLFEAYKLKRFTAPRLTHMGHESLCHTRVLPRFTAPELLEMGHGCLKVSINLTHFVAPKLTLMDEGCLREAYDLIHFEAQSLTQMFDDCLYHAPLLTHFEAPILKHMGRSCLENTPDRKQLQSNTAVRKRTRKTPIKIVP